MPPPHVTAASPTFSEPDDPLSLIICIQIGFSRSTASAEADAQHAIIAAARIAQNLLFIRILLSVSSVAHPCI